MVIYGYREVGTWSNNVILVIFTLLWLWLPTIISRRFWKFLWSFNKAPSDYATITCISTRGWLTHTGLIVFFTLTFALELDIYLIVQNTEIYDGWKINILLYFYFHLRSRLIAGIWFLCLSDMSLTWCNNHIFLWSVRQLFQ